MNQNFTKLAFTDSVNKILEQYGSRKSYARFEISGDIMDTEKKTFGFIPGIIHPQDFFRPSILIASSLTVTDIFI